MNKITVWLLASRPKTLLLSLSPVLLGSALAWQAQGQLFWGPLLAAALGAGFIQIGTNLFNDVGDFLRGTDQPGRVGPARATAEGWLTPQAVLAGAWLCFALAFVCGIYLVWHGGWPIVAIGLSSLLAGWSYTGGPRPIAYGPLGEVFVLVFFGLVAVGGSYYLQTLSLTPTALLAGLLLGLHSAAVISVNNYRDRDGDQQSGRRTLAVLLSRKTMKLIYAGELLLPYCLLPFLPLADWQHILLPLLALPLARRLIQRFRHETPGPEFNAILAITAAHQFIFATLLSFACVI